ncbi:hypothetical protein L208DRAFT_891933 [Tricholoma matsutake]|nr:hypothetical protein L208DRAFT_891933 [Tricholoma matsutake 945]
MQIKRIRIGHDSGLCLREFKDQISFDSTFSSFKVLYSTTARYPLIHRLHPFAHPRLYWLHPHPQRPSKFEDSLIFNDKYKAIIDWYYKQRGNDSTTIHMMQLRNENVAPFHEFLMVSTPASHTYRVDPGNDVRVLDMMKEQGVPPLDMITGLQLTSLKEPLIV